MLSNTIYFMVGTVLPFLMLQYIAKYIVPKNGKTYFLDFSAFFIVLAEASFITNIPGKYYFYFDENGIYQFGQLHFLIYIIQLILITISGLNIVLNRKLLNRKQLFSTASYVVLILIGCGGQAILFPNITLFLYASAQK